MAGILDQVFEMVKEYGPWALVLGILAAQFMGASMDFLAIKVLGFSVGVILSALWIVAVLMKK